MEPTQTSTSSKLHKSSIPLQNSHFYPPQPWLNSYTNPSMFFSSTHRFNLNQDEDEELEDQTSIDITTQKPNQEDYEMMEMEPMFEKPLTPSDVGKLNRLVIPKHHAEKYFPLGRDSGDKVLLLSFEDELGKCWFFRYSYWNSSQSYVLTKGWSRYVKEKQLDAGDIILFQRHRTDGDRLFIGWRRRGVVMAAADGGGIHLHNNSTAEKGNRGGGGGGSDGGNEMQGSNPYLGHIQGHGANLPYQPDCLHADMEVRGKHCPITGEQCAHLQPALLKTKQKVGTQRDWFGYLGSTWSAIPMSPSSSVSSQGPTHHFFYSQSYTSSYMLFQEAIDPISYTHEIL